MRRQLPPSKLLVPPGPQAFPQRNFLAESTVVVNHYSGIEKAIPTIPSLPGFKTSAGMFFLSVARLGWLSCDQHRDETSMTSTTSRYGSWCAL
jgi:hypothetical protein